MIHVHVYKVFPHYADLDIDTEDPEKARREAIALAKDYAEGAESSLSDKLKPAESEFIAIIQRKKE
jgi:hypothetical protein